MTILRNLTFDDVLLVPAYNHIESRQDVSTQVQLGPYAFEVPIISANMDTITNWLMAREMASLGGLGILHRFNSIDDNRIQFLQCVGFMAGVSIGVQSADLKRFDMLYNEGARLVCIDVAHGHSKLVGKMIKQIRDYTGIFIIAGNISTYAGADYLVSMGAHAVKVGQGAGSVCTTRIKTGFGVPQLTAIMDCAKIDVPIIADGGMRTPGDVVKALAAGATMVMLGSMLAGATETPGKESSGFKKYRGSASRELQEDCYGVMPDWKTAEGISTVVPHKGPVSVIINDIVGGLRSGLTYAGAKNITELHRKAQFIEVTRATTIEGTAHIE